MSSQTKYILFSLSLLAMCLLVSCGGTGTNSTEVGGANFSLVWQDVGKGNVAKQVTKGEICTAIGIDQIKVSYMNGATEVQSQTFACSAGSGTVTGIPVGSYTLKVEGLYGGKPSWRGELTNAIIEANKITTHGTVLLAYVGSSKVTPSAGANGTISPSAVQDVDAGATGIFTITPASGYSIVNPIGGSCPQGTLVGTAYTTGLIVADCTVAPTFSNVSFNVTPSAGANGSVTPATVQSVATGATRVFAITPNSGYAVITPIGGSCPQGNLSGTTYTTGLIVADCTVEPVFSNIVYHVTPSAGTNGRITPSVAQLVASGTTRQFAVTPGSGYQISSVTGCGGSLLGTSYVTGNVVSDCTIMASFSPVPTYKISGAVATASNVGIADVYVLITGSTATSTITDKDGNYSFTGAENGSYKLTPSLDRYTFAPSTREVLVQNKDLPGQNFTGSTTYSISGTIKSGGSALAGVTVTQGGSDSPTAVTNSVGTYNFSTATEGSYTLTPGKAGYAFTPTSQPVTVSGANPPAINFTATANTIPAAPTVLIASATGSRIDLSWNDNAGTNNAAYYKIERANVTGGPYNEIVTVAANLTTTGTTTYKYTDLSVADSTTYYYRVCATNIVGDSGYTAEENATTTTVISPEFVNVSGGTFTMGDIFGDGVLYSGENLALPTHQVTVGNFSIGKFEVTKGEWFAVMGGADPLLLSDYPVVGKPWHEVQSFITELNRQSGKSYRLPTEAEWEYAARSGGLSQKYSGSSDLSAVAWYATNSENKTHQVGQKLPNGLGIHDMSGNVLEWVSDRYGAYNSSSQVNPTGPATGSSHVLRGGRYDSTEAYSRTTVRIYSDITSNFIGFRLAAPF